MSEEVNDLLLMDAVKDDDGIKRDQYGRYMLADPTTGEIRPWTRATTLSGCLDDETGLNLWNDRNLAYGIGRREDLYAMAASVATSNEAEDKKILDNVIASAREAAAQDSKANLGTALHGFTQRYDEGVAPDNVPEQWKADVDAYLAKMAAFGLWPHEKFIERVLLVPELECAGTVDRLLMGDDFGLPVIGDLKTGKVEGKGRSFAIQLAIYAHATHWYDPKTKTYHEMPKVDQKRGIIVHLPIGEGRCDFYEVDIEAGWKAALQAKWVHEWRKREDLAVMVSKFEPAPQSKSIKVEKVTATGEAIDLDIVEGSVIIETTAEKRRNALVEKAKSGEPMTKKTSAAPKKKTSKKRTVEDAPDIASVEKDAPPRTHRVCGVCETEIPVGEYAAHAEAHLFDARFAYAKARVKYVIEQGEGQELGDVWANACGDIPTFKSGGPRSMEEIDRILGACSLVEMAHSIPFPDFTDPAKQKQHDITRWIGKSDDDKHQQQQLASR